MKTPRSMFTVRIALCGMLGLLLASAGVAFSQGSLTPVSAPVRSMRTLLQVQPRVPVQTLPYVIDQPGSYYLTGNLSGATGIVIEASNVTLDMQGFDLVGAGPSVAEGIRVDDDGPYENVVIRNGKIRNWGDYGIDASTASFCHFEDLQLLDNSGVGLAAGASARVIDCTVIRSGDGDGIVTGPHSIIQGGLVSGNEGIGINAGDFSIVNDSVAASNAVHGIEVGMSSTVRDCTTEDNLVNGIWAGPSSVIISSTANDNGEVGIYTSFASEVGDCTANNNGTVGIVVNEYGMARDSVAMFNGSHGINAFMATSIIRCGSYANGGHGIAAGPNNTISECTVADNTLRGIHVSDNNTIRGCTVSGNQNEGIYAGSGNTIKDCTVNQNHDAGIVAADDNVIEGCTVIDNQSTGISVQYDNTVRSCTVNLNQNHGIVVGARNRIENNHVNKQPQLGDPDDGTASGGIGIHVLQERNTIKANSFAENEIGLKVEPAPASTENLIVRNMGSGNIDANYEVDATENRVGMLIVDPNAAAANAWANFDIP